MPMTRAEAQEIFNGLQEGKISIDDIDSSVSKEVADIMSSDMTPKEAIEAAKKGAYAVASTPKEVIPAFGRAIKEYGPDIALAYATLKTRSPKVAEALLVKKLGPVLGKYLATAGAQSIVGTGGLTAKKAIYGEPITAGETAVAGALNLAAPTLLGGPAVSGELQGAIPFAAEKGIGFVSGIGSKTIDTLKKYFPEITQMTTKEALGKASDIKDFLINKIGLTNKDAQIAIKEARRGASDTGSTVKVAPIVTKFNSVTEDTFNTPRQMLNRISKNKKGKIINIPSGMSQQDAEIFLSMKEGFYDVLPGVKGKLPPEIPIESAYRAQQYVNKAAKLAQSTSDMPLAQRMAAGSNRQVAKMMDEKILESLPEDQLNVFLKNRAILNKTRADQEVANTLYGEIGGTGARDISAPYGLAVSSAEGVSEAAPATAAKIQTAKNLISQYGKPEMALDYDKIAAQRFFGKDVNKWFPKYEGAMPYMLRYGGAPIALGALGALSSTDLATGALMTGAGLAAGTIGTSPAAIRKYFELLREYGPQAGKAVQGSTRYGINRLLGGDNGQ